MPQTQHQAFCHRCNKLTLHTREIERPNHGLHWVIILFCCGLWIPFYVLLLLFPTVHPWMCAVCGERFNAKVARRVQLNRIEAAQDQQRAQAKAQRQAASKAESPKSEAKAHERREAMQRAAETTKSSAAAMSASIIGQLKATVMQANRPIEWMAGDDVFLMRIYQGLFGLLGLGIAGVALLFALRFLGFR